MYRPPRLVIAISLVLVIAASTRCFRAVKYTYGEKSYLSRIEADAAHRQDLERLLSMCQIASQQLPEQCILIKPTHSWIKDNCITTKGVGPKSDMFDYLISYVQRGIDAEFQMIIQSGVFASCRVVEATEGNGEGENLSSTEAYEIRVVTERTGKKKLMMYYEIYPPHGQKSRRIGAGDVQRSAIYGWGYFADQCKESVSN